LVEIGLFVVKEMMTNPDDALAFIQSIQEKVKTDVESRVLCMVAIGDIKLKSLGAVDDVKVSHQLAPPLSRTFPPLGISGGRRGVDGYN
jgi:hypothetical protein